MENIPATKITAPCYDPVGCFGKHFVRATGSHEFRSESDIAAAIKDLMDSMRTVTELPTMNN